MTEMSHALQIKEKILSLQKALLEQNPRMPGLLQEIHQALSEDPDIVTLLKEPEIIAIVVGGLKVVTNTQIVAAALKTKKKNITLDDI